MIEKAERNNQTAAPRWRSGEIGAHEHAWVTVGTDDHDEIYRQCSICDARTNVKLPRDKALFQDWLEYRAEWGEDAKEPAPEPVADDPLKTAAVIARTAEAVGKTKGADKDKDVEIVEPVAGDQAKTAAVIAATHAAGGKTGAEDDDDDEPARRGPGRPRKY